MGSNLPPEEMTARGGCVAGLVMGEENVRWIRLVTAAAKVCWFDWSSNDEDAVRAIDDLRAALEPFMTNTPAPPQEEGTR